MGDLLLTMSLSDSVLGSELSALEMRLKDLSMPLHEFGRAMMGSVARNFDEQGRPDRWVPLAKSTVKQKGSDTALVDTGRLRGSIGFRAGAGTLTLYANTSYAAIHQRGGAAGRDGRSEIPARPFLVFQEEDVARLRELLTAHLINRQ